MLDLDGLLFDDDLVEILGDAEGIIIYQLLWSVADDWGGYEAKFGSIALRSGALRLSKERVQQVITALIAAGKIIPYQVNGKTYHWIKNFLKHQKLTNPASPTIPLPIWIQFEEESYPSGKKYAKYKILNELLNEYIQGNTGSLPTDYQNTTGNLEKKRKEREEEREEEVRSAPSSPREPEPAAVEPDANPPTADASADLRDAPETPPVFQSKNFTVAQDYFDNLLAEYAGLTAEMLLAEIKKADDYCTDNHGRFKRRANGQLKNPRLFLRNWMARVVIPQQPRAPGNGGAARSGRNAVKICAWVDKTQNSESAWKNHEMSNASPPS